MSRALLLLVCLVALVCGSVLDSAKCPAVDLDDFDYNSVPTNVIEGTPENIDALLAGNKTLFFFGSDKCGHCISFGSTFEDLSQAGIINCVHVSCIEHTDICQRFGVRWLPTIHLVKNQHVYPYPHYDDGGDRSLDHLLKFSSSGYKKVTSYPVPSRYSIVRELLSIYKDDLPIATKFARSWILENIISSLAIVSLISFVLGTVVGQISTKPFPANPPVDGAKSHKD